MIFFKYLRDNRMYIQLYTNSFRTRNFLRRDLINVLRDLIEIPKDLMQLIKLGFESKERNRYRPHAQDRGQPFSRIIWG